MHHPTNRQAMRAAHRTWKSSLDPYVLDEVAFTLSDIRRARAESDVSTAR
jgi:hydroxyethylthiazole kinase-like sugar kinase family protein